MNPWREMTDVEKAEFVRVHGPDAAMSAIEWSADLHRSAHEPPAAVSVGDGRTWTPIWSTEEVSLAAKKEWPL